MKLYVLKSAIISILLLTSSIDSLAQNWKIELVANEHLETISLKIWDTKQGSKYKFDQAQRDALNAVLFTNIINDDINIPPLLTNSEEKEKFKPIEDSFFSKKGDWSLFTKNSTAEESLPTSISTLNWKCYQIKVSRASLKKYLEDKNIKSTLLKGF
jgi:hypothetical protein